ncbi:MAG: AmmeMemoRadiSam system radical SAM enzyme [Limisphaerales bacterium]
MVKRAQFSPTVAPAKSRVANEALANALDRQTIAGTLWQPEGDRIRCVACGHRCLIAEGRRGICKVRFNQAGQLRVPFGYVAAIQCDPVEKKPFFHVHPGSDALTFGMMGCDFHCSYCQNWVTSQALRDEASVAPVRSVTADQLVAAAQQQGARLVVSSYNEPLITAEWAVSVFQKAKAEGFLCAFVSNGNATREALDFLRPWIAAYKIDLKSFNDQRYRSLGGTLEHVTDAVRMVHERGVWLEVLTLIVPGFNDYEQELRALARFIASVDRNIPWHVTAFHKDYKMTDPRNTAARDLVRAAEIGAAEGLNFVYAGNLPGRVGEWENTRCVNCHKTLIERYGYLVRDYQITTLGTCPFCQSAVPGVWPKGGPAEVRTGSGMAAYQERLPKPVFFN